MKIMLTSWKMMIFRVNITSCSLKISQHLLNVNSCVPGQSAKDSGLGLSRRNSNTSSVSSYMSSIRSDSSPHPVNPAAENTRPGRRSSQISGPSMDNLSIANSPFEYDISGNLPPTTITHTRKLSESGSISSMTAQLESTKLGSNQNLTMTSSHTSLPADTKAKYCREKVSKFLQQGSHEQLPPISKLCSPCNTPTPFQGDRTKLLTRRASDPIMCDENPRFSKSKSFRRMRSLNSMAAPPSPASVANLQSQGGASSAQPQAPAVGHHGDMDIQSSSFVTDDSLARDTDLASHLIGDSLTDGFLSTTIDDSDIENNFLDGDENVLPDMMKFLEDKFQETINNQNAIVDSTVQDDKSKSKNPKHTLVKSSSQGDVRSQGSNLGQGQSGQSTPVCTSKMNAERSEQGANQRSSCMHSQTGPKPMPQPPAYPHTSSAIPPVNQVQKQTNHMPGAVGGGGAGQDAVANQMMSQNMMARNMSVNQMNPPNMSNQWQQHMGAGNFMGGANNGMPNNYMQNNMAPMQTYMGPHPPPSYQQSAWMNMQMMQQMGPSMSQNSGNMLQYPPNMQVMSHSPDYANQWQNMMQNQPNFMMQQNGPMNMGFGMAPNQMMPQMPNQQPAMMGMRQTDRQSPMVQVPQISQSQHSNRNQQAMMQNQSMTGFPQNPGFPAQNMNQMGQMAMMQQQQQNRMMSNMAAQQRLGQAPYRGQSDGAMANPSFQQPANQNTVNLNTTQMSPSCNQVTSSTDVNKGMQTDTPQGNQDLLQCNLNSTENFIDNLNSISMESTHGNLLSPTALINNRSTSQNSFLDGKMTSQSTNSLMDTSNMVVNDMGSVLSQLAEENKYLGLR